MNLSSHHGNCLSKYPDNYQSILCTIPNMCHDILGSRQSMCPYKYQSIQSRFHYIHSNL